MEYDKFVEHLNGALDEIAGASEVDGSRELSLARTNLEQAALWASLVPGVQSVQGFHYARQEGGAPSSAPATSPAPDAQSPQFTPTPPPAPAPVPSNPAQ